MRNHAFYWKCDCPGSSESKRNTYFADKHTSESNAIARKIAVDFLGQAPEQFKCLKIEGNHFAYIFSNKNKKLLLRTDQGSTDDDYMAAESAIMSLLREKGLPVPELFATNTEMTQYPVRYQIMEFVESPTLLSLSRKNQLDSVKIANEFGSFLGELHSIKFPGFGFIDTEKLKTDCRIEGRESSWQDYFNKCLLKHLDYLGENKLLSEKDINRIEAIFTQKADFLKIKQGSLLHRDFAFWNILGTSSEIKAVIDWDDAVVGDSADDLGIVNCFNNAEFMDNLLKAYSQRQSLDQDFYLRIHFYTLRNMLWKTMIRHYMGYFDQETDFFLNENDSKLSLKDFTIQKIMQSIEKLEEI